jgi:hypothetical protein
MLLRQNMQKKHLTIMENIWDLLRSCDRLICPKNIDTTAALDDQIFATIYKAYFWGLCKWISQQNMASYGTAPPFEDPGIPIELFNMAWLILAIWMMMI